ncbi:HAD family hydrolase [Winogradskyella tangerina]|uniref:HAD family hydrolase n=1 Tax=Winogradskyella tangerina TaxID=2023240 RepID=UPI000DBE73EA|nr:HAD family phosphatase [Winogradskyella tangerina]
MIKTIIFDFGDVFINLDKQGAMQNALDLFELQSFEEDMLTTNMAYEIGKISTQQFIDFYCSKFPRLSEKDVIDAWNNILKDFPKYRLEFIQNLAQKGDYRLMLLSNTNELHIDFIKATDIDFYDDFKGCFEQFYLSHEIKLRKPDADIFNFVLNENNLVASECLFIDDTIQNTETASALGFHVWNIDETKEDIVNLFDIKKDLF